MAPESQSSLSPSEGVSSVRPGSSMDRFRRCVTAHDDTTERQLQERPGKSPGWRGTETGIQTNRPGRSNVIASRSSYLPPDLTLTCEHEVRLVHLRQLMGRRNFARPPDGRRV